MSKKEEHAKSMKKVQAPSSARGNVDGSTSDTVHHEEGKISARRHLSSRDSSGDHSLGMNHVGLLNAKYYNLVICVSGEYIYAHTYIVESRSKNLLAKVAYKKHKKNSAVVYESKKYQANFLRELIKYLYSDELSFQNLSLLNVVSLIEVSIDCEIHRLTQLAKKHLQASLTLDNIYDTLFHSHKNGVKEAEDVCMEFAVQNHSAFIMNPMLTEKLRDVSLLQRETILYSQMQSHTVSSAPRIAVPASTIVSDFCRLLETGIGSDMHILSDSVSIPCHRAIVSSASPILADLVEAASKDQYLVFPEALQPISADTCLSLLRHIYYGSTGFDSKEATYLIILAKKLQLRDLVSHCQTCILANVNNDTLLYSLQVAFDPIFEDQPSFQIALRTSCQKAFFNHFPSVNFAPLRAMPPVIGTYLLCSLQEHIEAISFKPGLPSSIDIMSPSSLSKSRHDRPIPNKPSPSARHSSTPSDDSVASEQQLITGGEFVPCRIDKQPSPSLIERPNNSQNVMLGKRKPKVV